VRERDYPRLNRYVQSMASPELPQSYEFEQAKDVLASNAPVDEKTDANLRAAREAAPFAKSFSPKDVSWLMNNFTKAPEVQRPRVITRIGKASLDLGDDRWGDQNVILQRPCGLDFPQLRAVYNSDPTLQAIVWTRIWQVQRFLRPSSQEWRPGFKIKYSDQDRKIKDADKDVFRWLERFLLNTSATFDPRKRRQYGYDNLTMFMAKHLQDSLALDSAPIELTYTAGGRNHGFMAVDGGRVFLTDPNEHLDNSDDLPEIHVENNLNIPDPETVIAVLAREQKVQAWYTHDDLLYPVRRPSSDTYQMGYGQPETEKLINIVTGFLNAMSLNMRGFSHNSIPKGILTLFGDFTENDLEIMKMEWDSYVQGITNSWRLPAMVSKDRDAGAAFVPIGAEFNEMYFSKWMTFLVAIKTGLYGMDPEEVNFEAFTNKSSSLSGSDTEERLASSKDKSLYPLLENLKATLNDVLYLQNSEVELVWTGLEADQRLAREEEEKYSTFAEYRAARGQEPTGMEEIDNAPMNPTVVGVYQTVLQGKQQADMQKQQMEMQKQMQPGAQANPQAQEADQDGNRMMGDHEGQTWQVQRGDQQPPMMAKAVMHEARLEVWP
jgi:hypothetical protein